MPTSPTRVPDSAHERIRAAALDLFAQRGYSDASTREIAARAAVSEITIFRHYRSKRDLYCSVLEEELKDMHLRGDALARVAEAPTAESAMNQMFGLIAAVVNERPKAMRLIYLSALDTADDLTLLLRKHLTELISVLAGYLHKWIVAGDLSVEDPRALVIAIATMACTAHSFSRIFAFGTEDQQRAVSDYSLARAKRIL